MPLNQNDIMSALKAEGYCPELDEEGDVWFRFEGGTYYIQLTKSDETYLRLVFPSFWKIDDEPERRRALYAANQANAQIKIAKVYLLHNVCSVDADHLINDVNDLEERLPRSLRAIQEGVRVFRDAMAH